MQQGFLRIMFFDLDKLLTELESLDQRLLCDFQISITILRYFALLTLSTGGPKVMCRLLEITVNMAFNLNFIISKV